MIRIPERSALSTVDRIFRIAGASALAALVVTGAMLAAGSDAWRVPFVAVHLLALIALLPLGVSLVVRALRDAYAEHPSIGAALRAVTERYPVVAALVALVVLSAAVSLSQFDGGVRWVRSAANLVTVALVLVLVARYLVSTSKARGSRG